jgi:predicted transposase YdaD
MGKQAKTGQTMQHDAYVRAVFVHPGVVAAQVRAMLPRSVVKQLNLRRVEAVSARFIDPKLSSWESDAVFQVASASGDMRVFLLLEHQRTAPWHMPFRVLRYVTAFWTARLAAAPSVVCRVVRPADRHALS